MVTPAGMKLAGILSDISELPKFALYSIYRNLLSQLEEVHQVEFDSESKKRIWRDVSKERLLILKHFHQQKLQEVVKLLFNEAEIQEVLSFEEKCICFFVESKYASRLQVVLTRDYVYTETLKKAEEITKQWKLEITRAVSLYLQVASIDDEIEKELQSRETHSAPCSRRSSHSLTSSETIQPASHTASGSRINGFYRANPEVAAVISRSAPQLMFGSQEEGDPEVLVVKSPLARNSTRIHHSRRRQRDPAV